MPRTQLIVGRGGDVCSPSAEGWIEQDLRSCRPIGKLINILVYSPKQKYQRKLENE